MTTKTLTVKHDHRSYRVTLEGRQATRVYDVSHGKTVDLSSTRAQRVARKALKQDTDERLDPLLKTFANADALKRRLLTSDE